MSRPLLLIVDGESLKALGFEKALEKDGWDLAWTNSRQALNLGLMGQEPSLLLVDLDRSGEVGAKSVLELREQNPHLPVVAIRGQEPLPMRVPVTAYLERDLAVDQWSPFLKGLLPRLSLDHKLTTEDLFGDILADIEGLPAPAGSKAAPAAPPRPTPARPLPAVVHAPVKPLAIQMPGLRPPAGKPAQGAAPARKPSVARPVPQDLQAPEVIRPASASPVPSPDSSILPDLFGDILGPLADARATRPAKVRNDFTLSEFSGIKDPFEAPSSAPAPAASLPAGDAGLSFIEELDAAESDVSGLAFIGSSDNTPAVRAPQQGAASLIQPPSPGSRAVPEPDSLLEPLEDASLEEFGNYYLIEKIAVGGMAELFKARQRGVHNFEKIVAIKRILPHLSDNDEFVRMFIDEAKLAAQLTHPNIVQIFDLGKASGFYYIAMEYVDGKDLRSLLRKVREYRSPFPEAVAAYVTMKVAMALDYAHRKRGMNDKELRLVHRDVSPQNVLISSEGAVKLVDFGIAKAATKSTQTMAGALKGKLLYMSPEQALGQSLDNRSDIYSLGLVLFELLTGERCFQADSELGVLEKVRLGKVQDIQVVNPLVSKDMSAILAKALQKNVDQRYGSARLMERDLKALLVRHGNEPTEHDVAEYVNTLLKGSKEQLDTLLVTHFAVKPPRPEPVRPVIADSRIDDLPTTVETRKVPSRIDPPPEIRSIHRRELPRWLLPVLLCIALAGLLVLLFFTGGSSS